MDRQGPRPGDSLPQWALPHAACDGRQSQWNTRRRQPLVLRSVLKMKQAYRPLPKLSDAEAERFRSKISCNGTDDCWPWTASCDENGRGMIRISGYLFKAPRVAYLLATGRDPGTQDRSEEHTSELQSQSNLV